jgi:hypothetical protein
VARITACTKEGQRTVHEISGVTTVGRAPECQICISGDPKISRQHCRIEQRGRDFMLTDLNSANGTRWNDQDVGRRMIALNSGDVIGVGGSQLRFEAAGAMAGTNRLIDRLGAFFDRLFGRSGRSGRSETGGPVFGSGTLTCSCGTVISIAGKPPGQKVGCPRCRTIYQVPGK